MKKNPEPHTSQDYDRKHKQDHIANNPRAIKDLPSKQDEYIEDARENARQEHTKHFTNREGHKKEE